MEIRASKRGSALALYFLNRSSKALRASSGVFVDLVFPLSALRSRTIFETYSWQLFRTSFGVIRAGMFIDSRHSHRVEVSKFLQ